MGKWWFWDDSSRSERNGSKIYVGNYTYLQSCKWGCVGDWKISSRILPTRNLTKRSLIGGDLNLHRADWKRDAEKASGFQAFVNNLVCDNGYIQIVSGPTRGDALLDIQPLIPESSFISCNILPGISDHNGVSLEVQWDENWWETKVEQSRCTAKQMF